jgi:hypothetical protein
VSVLVIDCTTMGAPPPTVTLPTLTATDPRRGRGEGIRFAMSGQITVVGAGVSWRTPLSLSMARAFGATARRADHAIVMH